MKVFFPVFKREFSKALATLLVLKQKTVSVLFINLYTVISETVLWYLNLCISQHYL